MAGVIATIPKFQFSANGVPMVGGTLETYIAGSTTPATTWQDSALTIANSNPISLDARGECVLWLDPAVVYKFVLKNAQGVIQWTQDNISNPAALANSLRADLAAATGASLVGFQQAGTGAVPTTVQSKLREFVSVKDFGAVGDGVSDDTAAIQLAIAAVNGGTSVVRCLVFPAGKYMVDQLVFDDLYNIELRFDGATVFGAAIVSRDALIKIRNAYGVTITGNVTVDGANNTNYASGVAIVAAPGGAINPANGVVTRLNWFNLYVYNARQGIRVGTDNADAQCSEITFFGANQFNCPTGLYMTGSQTGVSLVGCDLTSEPNANYPAEPQWSLIADGGFLTMTGGELLHAVSNTNAGIWARPATSATYSNPYPVLRFSAVHIEMAGQLAIIGNPNGLSSPDGGLSDLTFSACSGYVSNAPDALSFIDVTDGSYNGTVSVKQSKFYKSAGSSVRSGANINCYGAPTSVSVDRESFGRGFKNWMGGVVGGSLLHSVEDIILVSSLNSVTYPAAATRLVFTAKVSGSQFDRYGAAYSTSTGVFTVPSGGLKTLRVEANCSAPGLAGDIYVKLSGAIVAFGQITGTTARVNATLVNLAAGATVEVILQPSAPATFGSQVSDTVTFSASN